MAEKKVTKEMGIMEVVQMHPAAGRVFAEHGLGCVGCAAAKFESIEQGAKAHGMDDSTIDDLVEALNKAISD